MDYRSPSEKQYMYASAISETLEIPLPTEFSMKAYSEFISHYKNKYKAELQRYNECVDEDDFG